MRPHVAFCGVDAVMAFFYLSLAMCGLVTWTVRSMRRSAQRRSETAAAERQRRWAAAATERQRQAAAQHREWQLGWQLSRWPEGTTLDSGIANIDGIVPQVAAQNEKIESQVQWLNNLLHRGLHCLSQTEPTARYLAGDPEGIVENSESSLSAMQLSADSPKASVAYSPQSRKLVVEYELPTIDIVPKAESYRYVKNQNQVVETQRPPSQVENLYAGAIAQLTLLSLAQIFRADIKQHIDVVDFYGVVGKIDPHTGKSIRRCLVTVQTTRDTFSGINLAQVDPATCLKHLDAEISLVALDDRPNLMDLTSQQFESVIRNLFEKIGLNIRQTRPSGDGGVDCVAYNTAPIVGGKVVIQAKRYKNTVGVSVVRDLYGAVRDEGASKGILVTTSGYGEAAYDFAEGKPIELFDGAQLLHLLETYAGIKALVGTH